MTQITGYIIGKANHIDIRVSVDSTGGIEIHQDNDLVCLSISQAKLVIATMQEFIDQCTENPND